MLTSLERGALSFLGEWWVDVGDSGLLALDGARDTPRNRLERVVLLGESVLGLRVINARSFVRECVQ